MVLSQPTQNEIRLDARQVSAPNQSPSSAHSCSIKEEDEEQETVFAKLYSAADANLKSRRRNEELRKQREVQYCTFKPRVKSCRGSSCGKENVQGLYDRLSSCNKAEKLRYLERQRKTLELQYCTFVPNAVSPRTRSQCSARRDLPPIYERLHKERELRESVKRTKQEMLKNRELDGCTFFPSTNSNPNRRLASTSTRDLISDPCERLYQDHEKKARELTKNELDSGLRTDRECTFKPSIVSRLNRTGNSGVGADVSVYEKLYREHMQKQAALEMKRMEQEQEEKRQRRGPEERSRYSGCNTVHSPSGSRREGDEDIFERLHNLHKQEAAKKAELAKRVLQVRNNTC